MKASGSKWSNQRQIAAKNFCQVYIFIFVVSNFLFLTLSHIFVIFFITILVMFKILTSCRLCDMVRKANCLFASFPRVGPYILTRLFQSYCLSLYGSGLWLLSSPALQNIEVAFNKILHRIWSLPLRSHSCIVHLVANLHSLFNVIYCCSNSLLLAATQCPSLFVRTIFHDSSLFCFSFCGYNTMFGSRHIKQYYVKDFICAAVNQLLALIMILNRPYLVTSNS